MLSAKGVHSMHTLLVRVEVANRVRRGSDTQPDVPLTDDVIPRRPRPVAVGLRLDPGEEGVFLVEGDFGDGEWVG